MITGTVTAKPQVFAAAVRWAAKFVAAKPSVPVQGCLRLTAAEGRLTIESYNEYVEARAILPVGGDGAGTAVVSGRLLDALVGTFPDRAVEIGAEAEGVAITAGRWHGTLPTMPAGDWPAATTAAPPTIGTVGGDAFADLVHRTAAAASDDLTKQIQLACVHLIFGPGRLTGMATDSHRAALTTAPFRGSDQAASALVIAQVLTDVASAFTGPDEITVGLNGNVLALASATREVTVRQTASEYEAAAAITRLTGTELPRVVTAKVTDLLGPMKRAALMRDKDGPIAAVVAPGMITVHAKADQLEQKGSEDIDAEYDGPEHTMAFNPQYLADALTSAPGEVVEIGFNEADQRPGRPWHVVVSVPGDDPWRHLLMPLKLPQVN